MTIEIFIEVYKNVQMCCFLFYIDVRLQTNIYPIIQEKLGAALANWHPSDRSAKLMLKPWQRVLPEGSFVAFLVKHIVPKLQMCMQSLVINPHQQPLGKLLKLN